MRLSWRRSSRRCGALCWMAPCVCCTSQCPFASLRKWFVAGGDRDKLQELATKCFSCKHCSHDGGCTGAVSLQGACKQTGVTVLRRDHFARDYADGKVALCGSTKVRASCLFSFSRAIVKFQGLQKLAIDPTTTRTGMTNVFKDFREAGGNPQALLADPFVVAPSVRAHGSETTSAQTAAKTSSKTAKTSAETAKTSAKTGENTAKTSKITLTV